MGKATPGICRRCRNAPRRPGGLICEGCWSYSQSQRANQPRYYTKRATAEEVAAFMEEPHGGIMAAARLIERWQRDP